MTDKNEKPVILFTNAWDTELLDKFNQEKPKPMTKEDFESKYLQVFVLEDIPLN